MDDLTALLCFGVKLLLVLSSLHSFFSLSNLTSHYDFSFVGEPTGVAVTMSDLATQAFSFPPPTADPDLLLMGGDHSITTTSAPHSARLPSDSGFSMLPSG